MLTYEIWIGGLVGYYSSLVVWIIAQRTHHFHGKYSHSWMIGILLLIFAGMQVAGSPTYPIALTGLVAWVMPLIVTLIDVQDHRREGRGLFGHHPHCWMEEKHATPTVPPAPVLGSDTPLVENENWSSR